MKVNLGYEGGLGYMGPCMQMGRRALNPMKQEAPVAHDYHPRRLFILLLLNCEMCCVVGGCGDKFGSEQGSRWCADEQQKLLICSQCVSNVTQRRPFHEHAWVAADTRPWGMHVGHVGRAIVPRFEGSFTAPKNMRKNR